ERGCHAAGYHQGSPPGTGQHMPSGARRPGRLWYLGRFGRQVADPVGNEVPPFRLELALLAAGEVLSGLVTYRLAGDLVDEGFEVQMSRVGVHGFWPFSLRIRFSAVRAADRRLFTVPTGISSTSATSERLSPEPKTRPSTSRWADASLWIAPFTSASSARSKAITSGPGFGPGWSARKASSTTRSRRPRSRSRVCRRAMAITQERTDDSPLKQPAPPPPPPL